MKQKQDKKAIFEQQVNFLKKIAFFNDFDDHELKQLLAVSRWLKVPAGTLIIKENTMEKVFYILVRGNVSVFITSQDGKAIELTTLTTGATFGEMALVSETKRTAGVQTTSESYILMVEPDILNQASVFLQLKFYRRFCEILVSRLIAANKRMSDLSSGGQAPVTVKTKSTPFAPPETAQKEKNIPVQKKVTIAKPEPQSPPPAVPQRTIDLSDLPKIPKAQIVARTKLCRRIQAHTDLAINPKVTARLAPFLMGECDDTRKFSELIGCDPMLAAKILQQANSSFYRRTTDVTSIPHAMITMGIKHLQEVTAEESMKVLNQEESIFGGFEELASAFWLHSVVVGRIAELLKETIRLNIPEDIYLAGLFHDLGKLAMDQQQKDSPIRIGSSEWLIPYDVVGCIEMYVDEVNNFVLESEHCVIVDGVECITLGHMFSDPVVSHPVWGTKVICQFLESLPSYPNVVIDDSLAVAVEYLLQK